MCVIGVFEILHTLIGGYIRILVSSQIKRNACQILSVKINMILLRFNERMNHCFRQIILSPLCLITGDVLIIVEVGGNRYIDRSFISSFNGKDTIGTSYFPTFIFSSQSALKFYFPFQSFMQGRDSRECHTVSLFRSDHNILVRGSELCIESNLSGTIGGQSYHYYLIGK